MNRLSVICLLLASLGASHAQEPDGEAAYLKLRQARDQARRFESEHHRRIFEQEARLFLRRYPRSPRRSAVHLWLGDVLKETEPREAHREYLRSNLDAGRRRAEDLAFQHEAPPALAVESWLGRPIRPDRGDGSVVLLVFFSEVHPQTRKILPHLAELHERFAERGLELVGVAAVVDNHQRQQPEVLRERLSKRKLPFPVAIDEQRAGQHSVSLMRYRGAFVPWAVLIDRYGRVVWLGGLHAQSNTMALLEKRVAVHLAEPTYEVLARRVSEGHADALEAFAAIRTRRCATALASALRQPIEPHLRERGLEILSGLLPEGYLGGDPDAALARWAKERAGYRYSFTRNRLVNR